MEAEVLLGNAAKLSVGLVGTKVEVGAHIDHRGDLIRQATIRNNTI